MLIALNPQPVLDETGMWHWKDCQWLENGIGFPESGIDDYAPYKPGEIFEDTEGKRKCVLDVRVKKVCEDAIPSTSGAWVWSITAENVKEDQ